MKKTMKQINKLWLGMMFLVMLFFFVNLVRADSQTYIPCYSDGQTTIMCFGDSQYTPYTQINQNQVITIPNGQGGQITLYKENISLELCQETYDYANLGIN